MTYLDDIASESMYRLHSRSPLLGEPASPLSGVDRLVMYSLDMNADMIAFEALRAPHLPDDGRTESQVRSILGAEDRSARALCLRARQAALSISGRLHRAEPCSREAEDLAVRLWACAVVVAVLVDRIRSDGGYPGLLVALEGIDGSGKSTLLDHVAARIDGIPVVTSRFPMSFNADDVAARGSLSEESLRLLFLADMASGYRSCIKGPLESGSVVVVDRFWASTMVYTSPETQGYVSTICETMLPSPDLTVLVQVPPRVAVQRLYERDGEAFSKGAGDSTEKDLFHRQRAYRGLLRAYEEEGDTALLEVDGRLDPDVLAEDVADEVKALL